MDTSSLRVISANLRGFRTNVGELTHSFVLKNSVDVVVTVDTFLDESCVTICDKISGYSYWVRRDHHAGQEGGIVVFHRDSFQVETLQINVLDIIEILFSRIILENSYLTEHLDDIIAAHNCQNVMLVGDLNQHLVMRAFTEFIVVQGLHNHVDFPTHQLGGYLDPVLIDLCHAIHWTM